MRATPLRRRAAAIALVAGLGLFGLPAAGQASGSAAASAAGVRREAAGPAAAAPDYRHACDVATPAGVAACMVLLRTDIAQQPQSQLGPDQPPAGAGYGPASLQNAYALPSSSAGSGETVAIVDAYDDPKAEADLATYRADWGLPPCTTANGCFTKVNQDGQASPLPPPSGSTGWATEESLDIDMVSAICPNCHILLLEGDAPSIADLGAAENTAVRLGAMAVSNSYATTEYTGEAADDAAFYDHPGVAVTASSGDAGYQVNFPAVSPHVVAVGGTSLTQASNTRGWSETVWTGTGSGCSAAEAKPAWQGDAGCPNRTNNDVAADADPGTGVAIYDTYDRGGWLEAGGTSVSSPIIASVYALAGAPESSTHPASYLYAQPSGLNDVTTGVNGGCSPAYLCTGEPGYDGPTGWGTPEGVAAFGPPAGNIVNVANPGNQTATQDVAFSLQIRAIDSASGQTLTYAAAGLPPGLSVSQATGLISGTPTDVGSFVVKVTATDTTGASGSASFSISVISPVGFSGTGPQAGYLGESALVQVTASDAVAGRTVGFSASGLPDGLSIDPSTGLISGLPSAAGYYRAIITGTDSAGRTGAQPVIWYVAPPQVTGRTGPVKLAASGKCLTDRGGSTTDGNPVDVAPCKHTQSQAWTLHPGGTLQVLGKCLNVAGGGTADGTKVALASCTGRDPQQWRIASFGELVNPASGRCLNDPGPLGSTGIQADIGSCTGAASQRWITPPGPIVSAVTGLCADSGAKTTGHLQVWYCGATAAQAWTVQPDGTVRVAGKCLDVVGATTGALVHLAGCNGTAAQQWRIAVGGTVTNAEYGKCLDDPRDSPVAATQLAIGSCEPAIGQLWHIE